MADKAPLKYIDILNAARNLGNESLAMTILPGQGQIPPASAEFLAGPRNPFPNALPMPTSPLSMESLAGTLGQMFKHGIQRPGTQGIADRQDRGFFAKTRDDRMRKVGL